MQSTANAVLKKKKKTTMNDHFVISVFVVRGLAIGKSIIMWRGVFLLPIFLYFNLFFFFSRDNCDF